MRNKLSKWCIIYYFVNGKVKNLIWLLAIFSLMSNFQKYRKYFYVIGIILIFKLLRGMGEWLTTWFCFQENKIQFVKGILKREEMQIYTKDVQGTRISQNWFEKKVGIFNLYVSIKGNAEERKEISLKCVPEKYKLQAKKICQWKDEIYEEKDSNVIWEMDSRKIILTSFMSLSWTYLLSLLYIKDEIEEFKIFPLFSIFFSFLDNVVQQSTFLENCLVVLSLSILWGGIVNGFKYYKYKVCIEGEQILISRGSLEKSYATFKTSSISSYMVTTNLISELMGFAKLSVEGQEDEERGILLDIIPFEKKILINSYLESWFGIKKIRKCQIRKNLLVRFWETVIISLAAIFMYLILNNFFYEQKVIWVIVMIYVTLNMVLKSLFTSFSINDKQLIVHKAGIKNKISYVFLGDIVNIELEESFFHKLFGLCNLRIDIISNNDEKTFSFRNFKKKDINEFLKIWRKNNG